MVPGGLEESPGDGPVVVLGTEVAQRSTGAVETGKTPGNRDYHLDGMASPFAEGLPGPRQKAPGVVGSVGVQAEGARPGEDLPPIFRRIEDFEKTFDLRESAVVCVDWKQVSQKRHLLRVFRSTPNRVHGRHHLELCQLSLVDSQIVLGDIPENFRPPEGIDLSGGFPDSSGECNECRRSVTLPCVVEPDVREPLGANRPGGQELGDPKSRYRRIEAKKVFQGPEPFDGSFRRDRRSSQLHLSEYPAEVLLPISYIPGDGKNVGDVAKGNTAKPGVIDTLGGGYRLLGEGSTGGAGPLGGVPLGDAGDKSDPKG